MQVDLFPHPLCALTGVMIMQRGTSLCDVNVCTLCKCSSWGKEKIGILAVMSMECGLRNRYWHFVGMHCHDLCNWKKDWVGFRETLALLERCPVLSAALPLCGCCVLSWRCSLVCSAAVLVSVSVPCCKVSHPRGLKIQIISRVMLCHCVNTSHFEGRFQASAMV